MKKCPYDHPIDDESIQFCPICGAELIDAEPLETKEKDKAGETRGTDEPVEPNKQGRTDEADKQREAGGADPFGTKLKIAIALIALGCVLAVFLFVRIIRMDKHNESSTSPSTQEKAESSSVQEETEASSAQEKVESSSIQEEAPDAQESEKQEIEQREVSEEILTRSYTEVLENYREKILSYESKMRTISSDSGKLCDSQVAVYDFNGDGVTELLFVADTDQGNEVMKTIQHDLYVFAHEEYAAVPILQKTVFVEAGGMDYYLVGVTSDHKLLFLNIRNGEQCTVTARKYGLNVTDISTEYSLDADISYKNDDIAEYKIKENNAETREVDQEEFIRMFEAFANDCETVLLCNYLQDCYGFYDLSDKPIKGINFSRAMRAFGADLTPDVEPNKYYYYNGHTYAFYNAEELGLNSYSAVAEFCRKQKGHLAVINDRKENDYLFRTLKDNYALTAFFGYSDEKNEGDWVWAEGTSWFTNWTTEGDWDLPDNGKDWGGDEDYAEFNYERGKTWVPCDGTWNDAPFRDNTDTFICEWDYEI